MEFSIQSLTAEHRVIEAALEVLAVDVRSAEAVRRVRDLCARHFEREEVFLVLLAERDAVLAAKLRGQHDEALEIAVRLEEAVAAGEGRDVTYLARRLLAIVQHNIIEEERDVFPCLGD